MSLFFRMLRHLLPTGRAWRLTVDKALRRFFEGLSGFGDDVRLFLDQVWEDLFPSTTRQLATWEKQHGLAGKGTDEERVAALIAEWQALGGQSLEYIQDVLRAAGFPITLHEHWISGRGAYDLDKAYFLRGGSLAPSIVNILSIEAGARGSYLFLVADFLGTRAALRLDLTVPYQFHLGAALTQAIALNAQTADPRALKFSKDGQRYYVLDWATARVYEYSCSIPWSFTGSVYTGDSLDISVQEPTPNGMALSSDGSHLYIVGQQGIVFQFDLATAGALGSGGYSGKFFVPPPGPGFAILGIALSKDGSRCALFGATSVVSQFVFDDNWQIDSLSPVGAPFDMTVQSALMSDLVFGGNGGQAPGYDNGTQLFSADSAGILFQYSVADYDVRNPHDYLTIPQLGRATCGGVNITCGGDYPGGTPNLDVVCSTEQTSPSDYLVNKDLTNRAPPPIPQDPDTWPYFFYVGGEVFGDEVPIPIGRRAEFDRLLLKLRPAQQWIGLFIDYQEGFILVDDDDFILTNDDDFILTN